MRTVKIIWLSLVVVASISNAWFVAGEWIPWLAAMGWIVATGAPLEDLYNEVRR